MRARLIARLPCRLRLRRFVPRRRVSQDLGDHVSRLLPRGRTLRVKGLDVVLFAHGLDRRSRGRVTRTPAEQPTIESMALYPGMAVQDSPRDGTRGSTTRAASPSFRT